MKGAYSFVKFALLVAVLLVSTAVHAQNDQASQSTGPDYGNDAMEAKFVGVAGGAILGAELVVGVEAIFKVKPTWAYLTFPLLGAAGGGVGGYFVEQQSEKAAVGMLVGGIVLIIPAALAAAAARSHIPEMEGTSETTMEPAFSFELGTQGESATAEETTTEVEARPDAAPPEGALPPPGDDSSAPSEEGSPDEASLKRGTFVAESQRVRRAAGIPPSMAGSLFYFDPYRGASMSVPAIDIRSTQLTKEQAFMGVQPGVEVHVPLLRVDLP